MMNSTRFFPASALGAIVLIGFGSMAFAQVPKTMPGTPASPAATSAPAAAAPTTGRAALVDSAPGTTSASFGDWVMRCQRVEGEAGRVCEVAQQMRAQDQQNPIAELAIGRMKKSDPLLLTVVLPVNVTFPSAPSFSADGKDAAGLDLGWRKCLPGGCFADVVLKDEVLGRWKTQTVAGNLKFKDASGRDLDIPVSSRGLSQALDALNKEL